MKRKFETPVWVSATDTRNFFLNDTLVDWLRLYAPDKKVENAFSKLLCNRGIEFEKKLVEYINANICPVVTVSTENHVSDKDCEKTIKLMSQGVPILHSAHFRSSKYYTKGIIDLLVKSDYLGKIFPEYIPPENVEPHYVVIDIKFSTLPLLSDGIHVSNTGKFKAYKSQLWIYTQGIGEIQNYTSKYAYILGRGYCYTFKGEKFSSLSCLEKLGCVDFEAKDASYKDETKKAIEWLRLLHNEGQNWSIDPPDRKELLPNMACSENPEWDKAKKELAFKNSDISEIWECSRNKEKALEQGIWSWKDPRFKAEKVGIRPDSAYYETVTKILAVNRQNNVLFLPDKLRKTAHHFKAQNEMFVDFETFADICDDFSTLPIRQKTEGIFLIGVYYKEGECWKYKAFLVENVSLDEEYRIMNEFANFVNERGRPTLWYWHAERSLWKKAEERLGEFVDQKRLNNIVKNWCLDSWMDLRELFVTEPIVIKDCFKFGLKEVAKAMRKHNMISARIESECSNGFEAAAFAWEILSGLKQGRMDDVVLYNEFDVKVIHEIVDYIRTTRL